MAEVIRQLEKALGIKSTNIENLLKSDNSWYKSEYTPPEKYKSFKVKRDNDSTPKISQRVLKVHKEVETEVTITEKPNILGTNNKYVELNALSPSINYLMSIAKNSRNTRAKVEARQALEYLKKNTDGDNVTREVFSKVEKAVEYLKGYFGG